MKTLNNFWILGLFMVSISFFSCKKDEFSDANVTIDIEHTFDDASFALNTNYVNGSGETIKFTKLKYYISNIQLLKSGNESWAETESYHLVDASNPSSISIVLSNVAGGEYTGIKFLIGVDSTRNVSGAQTGALDPANDMFWSWSTGYIFFKAEGTSPQSPSNSFTYHIGGFTGPNKGLRWVTLNFGSTTLKVNSNNENMIHLKANLKKLFDGSNYTLSVANTNNVMMVSPVSANIANNYSEILSFDHIHN